MEACCLAVSMKLQRSVVSTNMHTECIIIYTIIYEGSTIPVCVCGP